MNGVELLFVACDTEGCGYLEPVTSLEEMRTRINKPCPECGGNLCTQEDYDAFVALSNTLAADPALRKELRGDEPTWYFRVVNGVVEFGKQLPWWKPARENDDV